MQIICQITKNQISNEDQVYQGSKVPQDFNGSFPVSKPKASLILVAMNYVFFVTYAKVLSPSPHVNWVIIKQLQHPSQGLIHSNAHPKIQYLQPVIQPLNAFSVYPSLQSIHNGAHRLQQQELQKRYAKPYASQACQTSMHSATPQPTHEKQQH